MVFGLTLSYAQATFSVQGKVIDFHNKVPLSSAVIKIGNYTVISDAKGNFNFQQIKRAVSYTHLDVYKRQVLFLEGSRVNQKVNEFVGISPLVIVPRN